MLSIRVKSGPNPLRQRFENFSIIRPTGLCQSSPGRGVGKLNHGFNEKEWKKRNGNSKQTSLSRNFVAKEIKNGPALATLSLFSFPAAFSGFLHHPYLDNSVTQRILYWIT